MKKLFSASQYRDDVIDFYDSTFQVLATQISTNYLQFIKVRIIPELGEYSDIPLRELRTLMAIAQFDAPIRGTQISKLLSYDPASVTRSTKWLLDNGLIRVGDNSEDARSVYYGLSEKGSELSELYREVSAPAILELNETGSGQPNHQDVLQALTVLQNIRDRSERAVKVGAKYKRAQKRRKSTSP